MTYVFQCSDGHQFEERRAADDRDLPASCPECGEPALRRLVLPLIVIPGHFMDHVHTTGLGSDLGSGPWEGRVARRNRWNSGAYSYRRPEIQQQRRERAR